MIERERDVLSQQWIFGIILCDDVASEVMGKHKCDLVVLDWYLWNRKCMPGIGELLSGIGESQLGIGVTAWNRKFTAWNRRVTGWNKKVAD